MGAKNKKRCGMNSWARPAATAALLLGLASVLSACGEPVAAVAIPQPPDVSFVTVKPTWKSIVRELPGRIAPTRVADVRPRVSGIIIARLFEQGSMVKAGDPLYHIDPKPFEVDLQANEAAVAKARAVLQQATNQFRRTSILIQSKAVSEAENENALASVRQAEADLAARQADAARSRLNLEYATIRAPISGVIGAALLSEGALVLQNDTSSLATIQQIDPVYADFTQSISEMNKLRREFKEGSLDQIAPDAVKVKLVLDDGSHYSLPGKLLFSDARVDATTGQVTLRGEFQNPHRELLPGMYVRVQIEQGIDTDAILLPQQSVQRNAGGGAEVFVLKDDNRIAAQPIRTSSMIEGQWLISHGLKAGDKVVVEGFQKFAPGDIVTPNEWQDVAAAVPDAAAQTNEASAASR